LRRLLARLFGQGDSAALRAARWVVIDCETSGLDPARDRLLSIGALAVSGGRIEAGPGFSVVLRQEKPSDAANILVHGLGGEAQAGGRPAKDALREFSSFLGESIAVAFHAPFDALFLRRAMAEAGLHAPKRWLDLARLAPALFPSRRATRGEDRSLENWLAEFEIGCDARHDALADAYVTAQLLLVLLSEAGRQGALSVSDVLRLEHSGRWTGSG
jgi:DNA polymerase-3 subunit epsilon